MLQNDAGTRSHVGKATGTKESSTRTFYPLISIFYCNFLCLKLAKGFVLSTISNWVRIKPGKRQKCPETASTSGERIKFRNVCLWSYHIVVFVSKQRNRRKQCFQPFKFLCKYLYMRLYHSISFCT